MNITELRRGLDEIAAEVDDATTVTHERMAGVEAHVERVRRVRVAGFAAVAIAVVLAVVGLSLPSLVGHSPTPPTSLPHGVVATDLPTVTDNGVVFYQDAGGSSLVAEQVSTPGDDSLTMQVTPETLKLGWVSECWTQDGHSTAHFRLLINGEKQTWGRCNEQPYGPLQATMSVGGPSPDSVAQAWQDNFGAARGQALTIELQITSDGAPGEAPPQLAFGLFTYPKQRHESGVWLPNAVVSQGVEYHLTSTTVLRFSKSPAVLNVNLPAARRPYWIQARTQGLTGAGSFTIGSGSTRYATGPGYGSSAGVLVDSGKEAITVTFTGVEPTTRGRIGAGVYVPVLAQP